MNLSPSLFNRTSTRTTLPSVWSFLGTVAFGVLSFAHTALADLPITIDGRNTCFQLSGAIELVEKVPLGEDTLELPSGLIVFYEYRITELFLDGLRSRSCFESVIFEEINDPHRDPLGTANKCDMSTECQIRQWIRDNLIDKGTAPTIKKPSSVTGFRASIGFSVNETSPAWAVLDSQDGPDTGTIVFLVESAGPGDTLELALDGVVYFRSPMHAFESGAWYTVDAPSPTTATPLWTVMINSAGPADSSIYFPVGEVHPSENTVEVVNDEEMIKEAAGISLSPDGNTIYVADAIGDVVYRVPTAGGSMVALNIEEIVAPQDVAVSPDGHMLYVASASAGAFNPPPSIVSLPSSGGHVTTVVELPFAPTLGGLALSPNGETLYVALVNGQIVSLPRVGGMLTEISNRTYPRGLTVSQGGAALVFEEDGTLWEVPRTGGIVIPIATQVAWKAPVWSAVAPDGATLFVLDDELTVDEEGNVVDPSVDIRWWPGAIFRGTVFGDGYSFYLTGGADLRVGGGLTLSPDGTTRYFVATRASDGRTLILSDGGDTPSGNLAPIAVAGIDQLVECALPDRASVTLNGSASTDPDGDLLTFRWEGPFGTLEGPIVSPVLPRGTHTFTLVVDDGNGGVARDTVDVTVQDTQQPNLTVALSPARLWPPQHRLTQVTATLTVVDACDPAPVVELVSITSNEPDNGLGDGDTAGDIQDAEFGTNDLSFYLRAERSGGGVGRIYTVRYAAEDASGNRVGDTAEVAVPRNPGRIR